MKPLIKDRNAEPHMVQILNRALVFLLVVCADFFLLIFCIYKDAFLQAEALQSRHDSERGHLRYC